MIDEINLLPEASLAELDGRLSPRYPPLDSASHIGLPNFEYYHEIVEFLENNDMLPHTRGGKLAIDAHNGDLIHIVNTGFYPIKKAENIVLVPRKKQNGHYVFPYTIPQRLIQPIIHDCFHTFISNVVSNKIKPEWKKKKNLYPEMFDVYKETIYICLYDLLQSLNALSLVLSLIISDSIENINITSQFPTGYGYILNKLQTDIVQPVLDSSPFLNLENDKRENTTIFASALKKFVFAIKCLHSIFEPPVYARSEKIDSNSKNMSHTGDQFLARIQNINEAPSVRIKPSDENFLPNEIDEIPTFISYKQAYDYIQSHIFKPTQESCFPLNHFKTCKVVNTGDCSLDVRDNSRIVLMPRVALDETEATKGLLTKSYKSTQTEIIEDFIAHCVQLLSIKYPNAFTSKDFQRLHDNEHESILYPTDIIHLLKLVTLYQGIKNISTLIGSDILETIEEELCIATNPDNSTINEERANFWSSENNPLSPDKKVEILFSNMESVLQSSTMWYGNKLPRIVGIVHKLSEDTSSRNRILEGETFILRLI